MERWGWSFKYEDRVHKPGWLMMHPIICRWFVDQIQHLNMYMVEKMRAWMLIWGYLMTPLSPLDISCWDSPWCPPPIGSPVPVRCSLQARGCAVIWSQCLTSWQTAPAKAGQPEIQLLMGEKPSALLLIMSISIDMSKMIKMAEQSLAVPLQFLKHHFSWE